MQATSPISLYVSVVLLIGYSLFLFYSMRTHKELFTTQEDDGYTDWSASKAIGVLAAVTIGVLYVSETLSATIERMVAESDASQLFIGAVVIAVIGAAAEIASAIRAARNDRMDLALAISMGGSVQIALFVAPIMVMTSYVVGDHPFQLVFTYESVIVLFFCVMIMMQLARDGRSTWFKGALLILVYTILAGGIFMLAE